MFMAVRKRGVESQAFVIGLKGGKMRRRFRMCPDLLDKNCSLKIVQFTVGYAEFI